MRKLLISATFLFAEIEGGGVEINVRRRGIVEDRIGDDDRPERRAVALKADAGKGLDAARLRVGGSAGVSTASTTR